MYLVYLIKSDNKSYVGMTNNFFRRIRQHNKEIKGGAKYTSKYNNWYPVCIIDGFKDKKSACQCEWRLKHFAIGNGSIRGANNKIRYLSKYLHNDNKFAEKWTSNCDESIKNQNLKFYIDDEFIDDFYKYNHNYSHKELFWK